MKIAYGVELAESVRKTEDKSDRANYGVWIRQAQYYFKPGECALQHVQSAKYADGSTTTRC